MASPSSTAPVEESANPTGLSSQRRRPDDRDTLLANMKVGYLNIRGLSEPAKLLSVCLKMRSDNIWLLVLGETRLNLAPPRQAVNIPGDAEHRYIAYNFKPHSPHSGGLSVLMREDLDSGKVGAHVMDLKPINPFVVQFTLAAFGRKYIFFSVYIPPSQRETSVATLEAIERAMSHVPRNTPTIVIGDFNAHVRPPIYRIRNTRRTNIAGKLLSEWAVSNDLGFAAHSQLPTRGTSLWTWRHNVNPLFSTIDHALLNAQARRLGITLQVKHPRVATDHRLLLLRISRPGRAPLRTPLPGLSEAEALPPRISSPIDAEWQALELRIKAVQPDAEKAPDLPSYVSTQTLELVQLRDAASGPLRHDLHLSIQRSLRRDRTRWITQMASLASSLLSDNQIHAGFVVAQALYRKRHTTSFSSTERIDNARTFFMNLLAAPLTPFLPPVGLPPLPNVSHPAAPTSDVIVAYTDGSYADGAAGLGIVSKDSRLQERFIARVGQPVQVDPTEMLEQLTTAERLALEAQELTPLATPLAGNDLDDGLSGLAELFDELTVSLRSREADTPDIVMLATPPISPTDTFRSFISDGFRAQRVLSYRAEVAALAAALLATPDGSTLHVISDSQAVVSLAQRIHRIATLRNLPELDLWRVVYHESFRVHFSVAWVKGHSGVVGNELADMTANLGRLAALAPLYASPTMNFVQQYAHPAVFRPSVPDGPPTLEELTSACAKLRRFKHPGPGGITADTIKLILHDDKHSGLRSELFAFFRKIYEEGHVPLQMLDGIMVLIPKDKTPTDDPARLRGITVIPTCAKVLTNVLADRLMSIPLHPAQHGFVRQLSTVHAVIALKLRIRRNRLSGKRLIVVYLDVAKAYDSVDRHAVLLALQQRGVGPNMIRLFSFMLDHERSVVQIRRRCSEPFKPERGARQGDPASPILFDFLMDMVIRETMHLRPNSSVPILYADDAAFTAESEAELQADIDAFASAMARYGMRLNNDKSKVQVFLPPRNRTSERVYGHGDVQNYAQFKARVVTCNICGSEVQAGSLRRHQSSRLCQLKATDTGPQARVDPLAVDDRVADLTDTDDEDALAMASRARARQMFGVHGFFYDMPSPDNNPSTDCVLCRGTKQSFVKRTQLNKHMQLVHGHSAVFTPLGVHAAARYANCNLCGMATLQNFMAKHQDSDVCADVRVKFQTRQAIKQAFAPLQPILVEREPVERVHTFKYLGVWLQSTDLDDSSIERNRLRAFASYGAMRRFVNVESRLTKSQRRAFINVVLLSSLLYGCETWALTDRMILRLRTTQQSFLRPASGLRYTVTPNGDEEGSVTVRAPAISDVLRVMDATDIESMVRRRRLALAVKIANDASCLANSAMAQEIRDNLSVGKGHALHPDWIRQVLNDASLVGIPLDSDYSAAKPIIDQFDFVGKPLQ